MKTSCYLIISGKESPYGGRINPGPIRLTKNKPSTKGNEVAIKVNIDLPDALFTKPAMEIGKKTARLKEGSRDENLKSTISPPARHRSNVA